MFLHISKQIFPLKGASFLFRNLASFTQYTAPASLPQKKIVETPSSSTVNEKASPPLGILTSKRSTKRQTRPFRQWNIWAYATAKNYSLKNLTRFIENERLYTVKPFGPTDLDGVCSLIRAKNVTDDEASSANSLNIREFFIFDEGAIVFWNIENEERLKIIRTLSRFAEEPLNEEIIEEETEKLFYTADENVENSHFRLRPYEDLFLRISPDEDENILERYTVSNAMVASAKLSVHESALESLAETLPPIIKSLKRSKIILNKSQLMEKSGQLFELRHEISLDSDLLDGTPDFYWDRESLSKLYGQAYRLFSIEKRTKVINEKLNYCFEFDQRMDSHLTAEHSHKLERYIIYLIIVEVGIGFLMVYAEIFMR